MSSAAHSKAIWRDSALGAAIPDVLPAYFTVGTDPDTALLSDARPDAFVFADVDGSGNYLLMGIADYDPTTMTRLDGAQVGDTVRVF
jgi:hypothetical protein